MHKNSSRTTAIIGITMALAIAGTAAVAAHPGDRDDRGPRSGKAGMGAWMDGQMRPGGRLGDAWHGGLRGGLDEVERREVSLQTADGVSIQRIEQGAVESATADAVNFSLASGEQVTVSIDEDTQLIAFEEQDVTVRGWSRTRLLPTQIDVADIEAGAVVVVWSEAEGDEDFVASRVTVRPADDVEPELEAEPAEAEADATDEAATSVGSSAADA